MVRSEPDCQLYLIIPPDMDQDIAVNFAETGALGNIACALLRADAEGKIDRGFGEKILRAGRFFQVPILFENDTAAAADLGADGVHIAADEENYTQSRRILGDDAIIGVDCGLSRHAGLTLGELGADYIAFSGIPGETRCQTDPGLESVIGWWSEIVTLPCVAWDAPTAAAARKYARAGADFVAIGDPIWAHAEGPANATAEFSANLAGQRISA